MASGAGPRSRAVRLMVAPSGQGCLQVMEGLRPGDSICRQMASVLETDDGASRDRAIASIGRARRVARGGQFALKSADQGRSSAYVPIAREQHRFGRRQGRQGVRTGDPVDLEAARGLKADHRALRQRAVSPVDLAR
jgi:hypothetical protein